MMVDCDSDGEDAYCPARAAGRSELRQQVEAPAPSQAAPQPDANFCGSGAIDLECLQGDCAADIRRRIPHDGARPELHRRGREIRPQLIEAVGRHPSQQRNKFTEFSGIFAHQNNPNRNRSGRSNVHP